MSARPQQTKQCPGPSCNFVGVTSPSKLVSHRIKFHYTPELEAKIKTSVMELIRKEDPDQTYVQNSDDPALEAETENNLQEAETAQGPQQTSDDDDLQFLGFVDKSEVRVVDVIIPGITSPQKMSDRKRKRVRETRQNNRIAEALRSSRIEDAATPLLALGCRRTGDDSHVQIVHRGRPGVASQLVIDNGDE